jgi:hypothetical protein
LSATQGRYLMEYVGEVLKQDEVAKRLPQYNKVNLAPVLPFVGSVLLVSTGTGLYFRRSIMELVISGTWVIATNLASCPACLHPKALWLRLQWT